MFPPPHHWVKHTVLWRKKYIHFFQVYFNRQRGSRSVSLQRQNDFTCDQGGFHVSFPLAWISWSFDLKKYNKKNCSQYTSTPLIRKHELLMSIVCIYVHSQQQEEKPVYLYTMASDGQTKESKVLGLGLGRFACASTGVRCPGLGQQQAALAFQSLLRARGARTALCHLWLLSCLGFVVSAAVQVSQQGVAMGESIRGQQLPDLLHCPLISHFLLLQGPD